MKKECRKTKKNMTKEDIAEEWEKLTFSKMKGVRERSRKELMKVLAYQKRLKAKNKNKKRK